MTVMIWSNSGGLKGRCDATCHNAKHPTCRCMCGGRYHGSARNGTFEEVRREHGEEVLASAKARCQAEGLVLKIPMRGKFVPLFGDLPLIEATCEA